MLEVSLLEKKTSSKDQQRKVQESYMTRRKMKMEEVKLRLNFHIAQAVDVSKVVVWPKDKVLIATGTGWFLQKLLLVYLTTPVLRLEKQKSNLGHLYMTLMIKNCLRLKLSHVDLMSLTMAQSTKASGQKTDFDTAEVFKFGKMDQNTKDTGATTWQTVREDLYIAMGTSTKVNGSTIKRMARELTFTWMVRSTLVSGLKTNNTDTVLKHGQMAHAMKETTNMERNMERVPLSGLTPQCLLVNSTTITFTEKVFTCGVMVVNMKVSGKIIKCTAKAVSPGLMVACTLGSTWTIRKTVMENSAGQTVEATKGTG